MKELQNKKATALYCAFAAGVSALIYIAILVLAGCIPFGSITVARNDALFQYMPFLSEVATAIKSGSGLLYSWSVGGSNMYGTILYYIVNPFNIVALLFDSVSINYAFMLIVGLNTMAISLTACWYFNKHLGGKGILSVLFALLYTFSGFYLAYYYNTMWLSALFLLPLIAGGIEKITKGESNKLYLFSLAFAIICNFYLGFMLCIFSVLYFFVCLFSQDINTKDAEDRVSLMPVLVKFGIASLFAGGIASITLLPVVFSLSNAFTKNVFAVDSWYFFNPMEFLATHLTGVVPNCMALTEETLPAIALGGLLLVLLPLYAFTKNISKNERVAHIALVLIFWASFEIPSIYYIWHGMSAPAGLPYRFSFLYCFVLVKMAYKVITNLDSVKKPLVVLPAALLGVVYAYSFVKFYDEFPKELVTGVIFTAVIYALFVLMTVTKKEKIFNVLILVVSAVQLAACGSFAFKGLDSANYATYTDKVNAAKAVISSDDFYRMEFAEYAGTTSSEDVNYQVNNGSVYAYNGISVFSSLADAYHSAFQYNMGNAGNIANSYAYAQQTPVYNTIFDVDYVMDNLDTLSRSNYYTEIGDADGMPVYKTNNTLGFGIIADKTVVDWDDYGPNSFSSQDTFWEAVTGCKGVYDYINIESVDFDGCKLAKINADADHDHEAEEHEGHEHMDAEQINSILSAMSNFYPYKVTDSDCTITITFVPEKTQSIFIMPQSGCFDRVSVKAGEWSCQYKFDTKRFFDLGNCDQGVPVELTFSSSRDLKKVFEENTGEIDDSLYLIAVGVNDEAYSEGLEALKANGTFEEMSIKNNKITATAKVNEDGVCIMPVPFDKGWTVYIDGEEAELIDHNTHLLMFEIPSGEHTLEMNYFPQGLKEGIMVSVASCLVLVLTGLLGKVHKMKEELVEQENSESSNANTEEE